MLPNDAKLIHIFFFFELDSSCLTLTCMLISPDSCKRHAISSIHSSAGTHQSWTLDTHMLTICVADLMVLHY